MHHHIAAFHPAAHHFTWPKPSVVGHDLLQSYTHSLKTHPLITKMMTGGALATCGDAIAQKSAAATLSNESDDNDSFVYDRRRAASFAAFDMAYRALQHVSFPVIVQQCQGQFATAVLQHSGLPFLDYYTDNVHLLAAMEQTLASQLGIVPFIYYPVFFALTGVMQGLTSEQAVTRAMENFVPLMKRNLVFWIPVQFVQFGFVPQELQIPFLSVCGLCWTFILSAFAGSTKGYQSTAQQNGEDAALGQIDDADHDESFVILLDDRQRIVVTSDATEEARELIPR